MTEAKLFIAGIGMINATGANYPMCCAAVNASKSSYQESEFIALNQENIIMANVPDDVFDNIQITISSPSQTINFRHERLLRLAVVAAQECVSHLKINHPVPTLLALPSDKVSDGDYTPIVQTLSENLSPWIDNRLTRRIATGRTAGIEAIKFAYDYLFNQPQDYILIVSADSFYDYGLLTKLDERLLTAQSSNGFVPGEAACTLLLTRHKHLAKPFNGHLISVDKPALAKEEGHIYSELPYKGEGLDSAIKVSLAATQNGAIGSIYSSMNGEHYWAKEYGVAVLRNQNKFDDKYNLCHPADCHGDLGAATGTSLIALAANNLIKKKQKSALVYSSSDDDCRSSLTIEKN